MTQLACLQQLSSTWRSAAVKEVQHSMRQEDPLSEVELLSFADQVGCVLQRCPVVAAPVGWPAVGCLIGHIMHCCCL